MNNLQKLETNKNILLQLIQRRFLKILIMKHFLHILNLIYKPEISKYKLKDLQGVNNTFFCGAYHGYGFHEDGIQSAAYISKMLGVDIPWKRDNNFYNRLIILIQMNTKIILSSIVHKRYGQNSTFF